MVEGHEKVNAALALPLPTHQIGTLPKENGRGASTTRRVRAMEAMGTRPPSQA